MISFDKLSYWEKNSYFSDIDFLIIGSGIVGLSCSLELRNKYPKANILVIERGYLPTGASTKNAGFACFGSPSEILSDLDKLNHEEVKSIISSRFEGLKKLLSRCGKRAIEYQKLGSYEIFTPKEYSSFNNCVDKLAYLNELMFNTTGVKNCFQIKSPKLFQFNNVLGIIKNLGEGQLNTGKMIKTLYKLAVLRNINVLFGIEVIKWQETKTSIEVQTNLGVISTDKLVIATNGLTSQLIKTEDIHPARAQVLVTSPIADLKIRGSFHYDAGYFYFRNIGNRILLGGGRNINFKSETTDKFETTNEIMSSLEQLLKNVILPHKKFSIDQRWSGIMGVGKTKNPIVKKLSDRISIGARLGGMGVALGSEVAEKLAKLN